MDERRQLIAVIASTGLLAGLLWMEMPPWQRELLIRAVRQRAYKMLHRLARASGRRAMGDELAGRTAEADAGYQFTERLSRARDAL